MYLVISFPWLWGGNWYILVVWFVDKYLNDAKLLGRNKNIYIFSGKIFITKIHLHILPRKKIITPICIKEIWTGLVV